VRLAFRNQYRQWPRVMGKRALGAGQYEETNSQKNEPANRKVHAHVNGESNRPSWPGTAVQIRQKKTVGVPFSFGFWGIIEILKNDTSICCPN
jgi:hypothetical protein